MFDSAISPRFRGGNFSVVHGNQINNHYLNLQSSERGLVRFRPGEEWEEMLYREYDRIPLGRIKLLKTLCHEPVAVDSKRRRIMPNSGEKGRPRAERVVEIASIVYDGRDESLPLLAVRYTGREAKELFKRDCIHFSRQRATNTPQVRAFNDSHIPIIIFNEELVPLRHFLERNLYSAQVLIYLRLRTVWGALLDGSSDELRAWILSTSEGWDLNHLLWLRPQTGVLCIGPPGPRPEDKPNRRLFVWLNRPALEDPRQHRHDHLNLPSLPLSMCSSPIFLDYVMHNVPEWLAVLTISSFIAHRKSGPAHRGVHCWKQNLMTEEWTDPDYFLRRVLKIPFHRWSYNHGMCSHLPTSVYYKTTEKGGMRVLFTQSTQFPGFFFSRQDARSTYRTREEEWLTQAASIFDRLSVPRREWPLYAIITGLTLQLTSEGKKPLSIEDDDGWNAIHGSPCYLFVPPPPQLPNSAPDIEAWLRGENLYYYSFDPEGGSAITEEERTSLGLPSFSSEARVNYAYWDTDVYNFMEQWQEAKGFDYTTTDYAESLGIPVLEVISQR
ncbi:hypothetical protein AAF712_014561 [Marasmius tenuissimus]|uniref:Uncharacterized protein n=1 Tax=Marasmius tenuissimus TaxID=585030 RepID=A0ABR2ZBU5_9AGAR